MPLTIYIPSSSTRDLKMFFDLNNPNDYTVTNDISHPTIDIAVCEFNDFFGGVVINNVKAKLYIMLDIFHNFEDQISRCIDTLKDLPDNFFIISNTISTTEASNKIIHNDFLFNRTKAYYNNYPFRDNTVKWYYYNKNNYVDVNLPDSNNKSKIFVAPNKTYRSYGSRIIKFRPRLVELLDSVQYQNLGYIGNSDDNPSKFLYSHGDFPFINNIQDLEKQVCPSQSYFGYSPPHNEYYKNTFISIYGETIEYGTTIAVTEKTYDPLFKGHFILPFSASGFISHLTLLGFKFPNFIDYSYDAVVDDEQRYQSYQEEVKRLLDLDVDTWKKHWDNNMSILLHNKNMFYEKSYDRIDLLSLTTQHKLCETNDV